MFLSIVAMSAVTAAITTARAAEPASRPNILWITSEDHGPHLGCYGDRFATTPHVDALAKRGLRYRHVWSNAPVCAPARTTLISGLYPPSTGAEHMRSMVPMPAGLKMYPQLLRDAGYYCTNNAKEDYNLAPRGKVWNESSRQAHWKNRPADQPFMAVFNSEKSHESRIRSRPHKAVHDPAGVRVPAYHPDTPEVRQDWAQYYDQVSAADADAGVRLAELAEAGLADDTIVFYFADHGSGMPRNKRWLYDSGLHVPLVVHIPEKFRHLAPADYRPGGTTDRLVSFVDFAPTLLSLAGVRPPEWLQGEAFLGEFAAPPRSHVFGFRGRMDERYDLLRSVTDGRFVYIRNYAPHRIYGQHVSYMFQTPTTRVWHQRHVDGTLNAAQEIFWNRKPFEELYDLSTDPDEVRNLAADDRHRETRDRLRQALDTWERQIRDVGFLPEGEMHRRAAGRSPYDMARDNQGFPFDRIFDTAQQASRLDAASIPVLRQRLADQQEDSAVRYWAALGLAMRGAAGVAAGEKELRAALDDPSPDVRIVAAEGLARHGPAAERAAPLTLLEKHSEWGAHDVFTSIAALHALDDLGSLAEPLWPRLVALPTKGTAPHARYGDYVPRLIERFKGHGSSEEKK